MMWAAGVLVAMSQLIYPSISAFVSIHSDRDKQGTVQGVITGVRGLCQGSYFEIKCFKNLNLYFMDFHDFLQGSKKRF